MKRWIIAAAALALLIAVGAAIYPLAQNPDAPGARYRVGGKVGNLTLHDLKGGTHSLFDLARGSKVTVLMFIATQCPVSNAYNERMAALDRAYAGKGVKLIAINSNRQESIAEVAQHAAQHGFGFTVYKDENNVLADLFGASVTPETYVFDDTWTMRYHGRIDDSQQPSRVRVQDLRNALDALLEGKPVPAAETKAFGCTIKRVRKT